MIKVGIVGVGSIGTVLARRCVTQFREDVRLIGVVDHHKDREKAVSRELGLKPGFTVPRLARSVDLMIEAASAAAAYPIAIEALSQGKDVMIMSSGGIVGKEKEIYRLARDHRCCVYLPSGAIAGIDALKSAAVGRIQSVSLVTRKAPRGFIGAPHVLRKKINLDRISKETLLFAGPAEKAIEGFPQNINVSATLSLAGIGPKKTSVKIYACPGLSVHIHEVHVQGEFGSFYTRTENHPSRHNLKTSQLAVFSAVATLSRILNNVKIGT